MPLYLGNNCYLYDEDGEIKIKTMNGLMDVNKFETKFGLMITESRGEWGGSLYNVTEFGAEEAGYGNFYHVFEYGDKVYAIETLSHLTMNRCCLHEIIKFDDRFEDITVFECYDLTWSGCYLENNYVYFYSNSMDNNGLYKFNLDNNELELIHKDLCPFLTKVNSLLKKENFIYIYGNYNVIKYDLNSHEMELFTNLVDDEIDELYLGRFRLREFWDEIFLDDG